MKKSEIKKRSHRLLLIGFSSFLLLVAGGIVDGYISHRWVGSDSLEQASSVIRQLPEKIGEWESKNLEISDRILTVAGATGYSKRLYYNEQTGDWISVTLLCGPHGPISLHPPTVCFTGAGWNLTHPKKTVRYSPRENVTAATWQAGFRRQEEFEEQEIVADWSWNDGTGWKASKNPRYEFAGSPYLFKLYIVSDVALTTDETIARRDQFVNALLNELDRTVFSSLSPIDTQDGSAQL